MLQIDNVTKQYGKFTALSEIDLSLENGVYGLLAPNGAGKTTLLKMLATLLFPTSGQIRLDGEDIFQMESRYREKIGYLPQEFGYYKNNTPRQFLRYCRAERDSREAGKTAHRGAFGNRVYDRTWG